MLSEPFRRYGSSRTNNGDHRTLRTRLVRWWWRLLLRGLFDARCYPFVDLCGLNQSRSRHVPGRRCTFSQSHCLLPIEGGPRLGASARMARALCHGFSLAQGQRGLPLQVPGMHKLSSCPSRHGTLADKTREAGQNMRQSSRLARGWLEPLAPHPPSAPCVLT